MNILDKYKISFVIEKDGKDKSISIQQLVITDINFYLSGYFLWGTMSPEIFLDSILPEIENAINGLPFDEDGGGFICFLTIGPTHSTLSGLNEGVPPCSLPTVDMKDIILEWINFAHKNNLQ